MPYEKNDINTKWVWRVFGILLAVTAFVYLFVSGVFLVLRKSEGRSLEQPPVQLPAPRLEIQADGYSQIEFRNKKLLSSYGWVLDASGKRTDKVRIPIDAAMNRLVHDQK